MSNHVNSNSSSSSNNNNKNSRTLLINDANVKQQRRLHYDAISECSDDVDVDVDCDADNESYQSNNSNVQQRVYSATDKWRYTPLSKYANNNNNNKNNAEDNDDDYAKIPLCKMHTNKPSPTQDEDEETSAQIAATAAQAAGTDATNISANINSNIINSNTITTNELKSSSSSEKRPSGGSGGGGSGDNVQVLSSGAAELRLPQKNKAALAAAAGASSPNDADATESEEDTDQIGDLMGRFGKWQLLMTVLLSLFQVPNTFHISSSVFQGASKQFWCQRPPHLNELPIHEWRNLSRSWTNCYQAAGIDWSHVHGNTSAASMELEIEHMLRQWQATPHASSNNQSIALSDGAELVACHAWEFEVNDNVGNSWSSQWELVCDKEYLKNVAEMFFLLGVATGGILSGYLSDKFGRKTMLFISTLLQTIFGLALYFVSSFEFYITLRALLGLVSVSVTYAGLILAIEYVDGKWRTIAGMYNLFPLPISYMLISGIAYLTQDYQRLQLCIGLPGVFLCFLWFVVPESPRWLLVKGRIDEVRRIIESAAKFNGRQLPPDYQLLPATQEVSTQGFKTLFRSRYLRRISICFFCIWFTMNLVYYTIVLNIGSFGGNIYLNSALAGLVEVPAIAIAMYIITKVGKKWLFCATFFATGISCCCAALIEGIDDLLWWKISFVMISKFTISAGNTIMPVYTAELYPTAIRNVGVGACNVAAGMALILTPYLSLLTKIEVHLLMILLTAWSVFGGFVVLFLPETMAQHTKKNPPEEKC